MIPEAAVQPRGGEAFVFLVEQDKAVERRVKLGQRLNGEVEILEGLDARSVVVVAGQQKLRDGTAIEALPSGAGAPRAGQLKSDVVKPEPSGAVRPDSNGPASNGPAPNGGSATGRSG